MELKIKISDSVYKKIQEYDAVPFDELFELFDAIRNGIPTDESDNRKVDENSFAFILNKKEADIFNSLSNEQKEVVCILLDNAIRNENPVEKIVSNGDCISRQAVLSKIKEVCFSKEWIQFRADYGSHGQRDFLINYIEGLPHVTPSQKRGQWLHGELIPNDITGHWYAECSECGKMRIVDNYCPHCGSKMEVKE